MMGVSSGQRMVQCPRCRAILQEPSPARAARNPYYKCGSCLTVLQAKHATSVGQDPRHPFGLDLPRPLPLHAGLALGAADREPEAASAEAEASAAHRRSRSTAPATAVGGAGALSSDLGGGSDEDAERGGVAGAEGVPSAEAGGDKRREGSGKAGAGEALSGFAEFVRQQTMPPRWAPGPTLNPSDGGGQTSELDPSSRPSSEQGNSPGHAHGLSAASSALRDRDPEIGGINSTGMGSDAARVLESQEGASQDDRPEEEDGPVGGAGGSRKPSAAGKGSPGDLSLQHRLSLTSAWRSVSSSAASSKAPGGGGGGHFSQAPGAGVRSSSVSSTAASSQGRGEGEGAGSWDRFEGREMGLEATLRLSRDDYLAGGELLTAREGGSEFEGRGYGRSSSGRWPGAADAAGREGEPLGLNQGQGTARSSPGSGAARSPPLLPHAARGGRPLGHSPPSLKVAPPTFPERNHSYTANALQSSDGSDRAEGGNEGSDAGGGKRQEEEEGEEGSGSEEEGSHRLGRQLTAPSKLIKALGSGRRKKGGGGGRSEAAEDASVGAPLSSHGSPPGPGLAASASPPKASASAHSPQHRSAQSSPGKSATATAESGGESTSKAQRRGGTVGSFLGHLLPAAGLTRRSSGLRRSRTAVEHPWLVGELVGGSGPLLSSEEESGTSKAGLGGSPLRTSSGLRQSSLAHATEAGRSKRGGKGAGAAAARGKEQGRTGGKRGSPGGSESPHGKHSVAGYAGGGDSSEAEPPPLTSAAAYEAMKQSHAPQSQNLEAAPGGGRLAGSGGSFRFDHKVPQATQGDSSLSQGLQASQHRQVEGLSVDGGGLEVHPFKVRDDAGPAALGKGVASAATAQSRGAQAGECEALLDGSPRHPRVSEAERPMDDPFASFSFPTAADARPRGQHPSTGSEHSEVAAERAEAAALEGEEGEEDGQEDGEEEEGGEDQVGEEGGGVEERAGWGEKSRPAGSGRCQSWESQDPRGGGELEEGQASVRDFPRSQTSLSRPGASRASRGSLSSRRTSLEGSADFPRSHTSLTSSGPSRDAWGAPSSGAIPRESPRKGQARRVASARQARDRPTDGAPAMGPEATRNAEGSSRGRSLPMEEPEMPRAHSNGASYSAAEGPGDREGIWLANEGVLHESTRTGSHGSPEASDAQRRKSQKGKALSGPLLGKQGSGRTPFGPTPDRSSQVQRQRLQEAGLERSSSRRSDRKEEWDARGGAQEMPPRSTTLGRSSSQQGGSVGGPKGHRSRGGSAGLQDSPSAAASAHGDSSSARAVGEPRLGRQGSRERPAVHGSGARGREDERGERGGEGERGWPLQGLPVHGTHAEEGAMSHRTPRQGSLEKPPARDPPFLPEIVQCKKCGQGLTVPRAAYVRMVEEGQVTALKKLRCPRCSLVAGYSLNPPPQLLALVRSASLPHTSDQPTVAPELAGLRATGRAPGIARDPSGARGILRTSLLPSSSSLPHTSADQPHMGVPTSHSLRHLSVDEDVTVSVFSDQGRGEEPRGGRGPGRSQVQPQQHRSQAQWQVQAQEHEQGTLRLILVSPDESPEPSPAAPGAQPPAGALLWAPPRTASEGYARALTSPPGTAPEGSPPGRTEAGSPPASAEGGFDSGSAEGGWMPRDGDWHNMSGAPTGIPSGAGTRPRRQGSEGYTKQWESRGSEGHSKQWEGRGSSGDEAQAQVQGEAGVPAIPNTRRSRDLTLSSSARAARMRPEAEAAERASEARGKGQSARAARERGGHFSRIDGAQAQAQPSGRPHRKQEGGTSSEPEPVSRVRRWLGGASSAAPGQPDAARAQSRSRFAPSASPDPSEAVQAGPRRPRQIAPQGRDGGVASADHGDTYWVGGGEGTVMWPSGGEIAEPGLPQSSSLPVSPTTPEQQSSPPLPLPRGPAQQSAATRSTSSRRMPVLEQEQEQPLGGSMGPQSQWRQGSRVYIDVDAPDPRGPSSAAAYGRGVGYADREGGMGRSEEGEEEEGEGRDNFGASSRSRGLQQGPRRPLQAGHSLDSSGREARDAEAEYRKGEGEGEGEEYGEWQEEGGREPRLLPRSSKHGYAGPSAPYAPTARSAFSGAAQEQGQRGVGRADGSRRGSRETEPGAGPAEVGPAGVGGPTGLGPAGVGGQRGRVSVNGVELTSEAVGRAEHLAGPIEAGAYWYDRQAGFWGVMGGPCLGIIPAGIPELTGNMAWDCSRGHTGVLVNGRELGADDLALLQRRGLPTAPHHSYTLDSAGNVHDARSNRFVLSLGMLAPSVARKGQGAGMFNV